MAVKRSSLLAQRYASALLDLAQESKNIDKIESDMDDIRGMIANSDDFKALLSSPAFGEEAQIKALNAVADKAGFQKLTKNFLGVLVQNRRLSAIEDITAAFFAELAKRKGLVDVHVTAAQDLSAAQRKSLESTLQKALGQDVNLHTKTEPGILGGLVVTVGSFMIDHSVRRKLEKLKIAMGGHTNQNFNSVKKEA